MALELARSKQTKIDGGDVNYYLVDCLEAAHGPKCVAEVEDVIEAAGDMPFAESNTFKGTVRLCKLRMDLGKPGSDAVYESSKGVYYADRTLAKVKRRAAHRGSSPADLFEQRDLTRLLLIKVPDPKRLEPYEVDMRDFTDALGASEDEAALIQNTILISILRTLPRDTIDLQLDLAERCTVLARRVNATAIADAATKVVARKVDGMALLQALLGQPIDDEVRQTRGRFGWLDALVHTVRQGMDNPAFRDFFVGDDPQAAHECLFEAERLVQDVRERLILELA